MKSGYWKLWTILTVSLIFFIFLAFCDEFYIGGWKPKKATFREALITDNKDIDLTEFKLPADTMPLEEGPAELDSLPKNIFLFGDSMTLNIALRMAEYAKQNGHKFHAINWDSSHTKIWAETDTLAHYLKQYKPDYIFICLGSNEVYFKDPTKRLPYIRKILELIDTVPYVWIGPPNWNEETTLNDMLVTVCRKGSFFRSEGIKLKRKKDNIHPTREATVTWVDSIMRWLPESSHPILAEFPADSLGKVEYNIKIIKALNK